MAHTCAPRKSRRSDAIKHNSDSRKGHEQIATTNIYLHADMTHKQEAIDRTRPLEVKPGRYRPADRSWHSWKASDYADNFRSLTRAEQDLLPEIGITQRSA